MRLKKLTAMILAVAITGIFTAAPAFCEEAAEDTYLSELTGEPISAALKDQRPVAVMVDNESIGYPLYGMADADIVYELINSTRNGHITRLMPLIKDWEKITKIGNIRSVRPTNIMIAAEWDAVLCHDGGPIYCDFYFKRGYTHGNFSGGFSRVDNGKAAEFTEYCLAGDLQNKFASSGVSKTYVAHAGDEHFKFVPYGTEKDMSAAPSAEKAETVALPFEHTTSMLQYDPEKGSYDYYSYGSQQIDAESDRGMTFENVFVLKSTTTIYDENGYMMYNIVDYDMPGYYLSNGYVQPITYTKTTEDGITHYYDAAGQELIVNTGKTYITYVPDDKWADIDIH